VWLLGETEEENTPEVLTQEKADGIQTCQRNDAQVGLLPIVCDRLSPHFPHNRPWDNEHTERGESQPTHKVVLLIDHKKILSHDTERFPHRQHER
jgi:hypothetical protein